MPFKGTILSGSLVTSKPIRNPVRRTSIASHFVPCYHVSILNLDEAPEVVKMSVWLVKYHPCLPLIGFYSLSDAPISSSHLCLSFLPSFINTFVLYHWLTFCPIYPSYFLTHIPSLII